MSVDPLSSKALKVRRQPLLSLVLPSLPAPAELPSQLPLWNPQEWLSTHEATERAPGWETKRPGLWPQAVCPEAGHFPLWTCFPMEQRSLGCRTSKCFPGFLWLSPGPVAGLESGLSSGVAPFVFRSRFGPVSPFGITAPLPSLGASPATTSVPLAVKGEY